ncbi:hypothetical protein CYY_009139 [Polysphondylium violaceum]|uniref:C3H1-type domain-containing protein n=1 Tax=Polysphondylium violaceum TaxID=133409 RepID=A0A8J4PM82_9MYCE|nr:hypothetical protein CYY_009139 [Polysphondylium violaceum]
MNEEELIKEKIAKIQNAIYNHTIQNPPSPSKAVVGQQQQHKPIFNKLPTQPFRPNQQSNFYKKPMPTLSIAEPTKPIYKHSTAPYKFSQTTQQFNPTTKTFNHHQVNKTSPINKPITPTYKQNLPVNKTSTINNTTTTTTLPKSPIKPAFRHQTFVRSTNDDNNSQGTQGKLVPLNKPIAHLKPKAFSFKRPVFVNRLNRRIPTLYSQTNTYKFLPLAMKRKLLLAKLTPQKPVVSSITKPSPIGTKENNKIIDSVFIKSGNSMVRKELNDTYISIGNRLIRQTAKDNIKPTTTTTTTSANSTPKLTTNPIKKKTFIPNKPINTINGGKRKLSDKIKDAIKSKKKQYCLYYNRFGKCNSGDKCKYIHDKSKIRTCPKFLSGTCQDSECHLKHEITDLEQMPICYLYLKGMCTKVNCPYLHVFVSKNAKLCPDFQKGYCPNGSACTMKHTYGKEKDINEKNKDLEQQKTYSFDNSFYENEDKDYTLGKNNNNDLDFDKNDNNNGQDDENQQESTEFDIQSFMVK